MVTCVHCNKVMLGGCDCSIREILAHQQEQIGRLEKMLPTECQHEGPGITDPTEEAFKVWCEANSFPVTVAGLRIFRGGADWASGRKDDERSP